MRGGAGSAIEAPAARLGRFAVSTAFLLVLSAIAGCASAPSTAIAQSNLQQQNDPFEPINREVYAFNSELREGLKPLQQTAVADSPLAPIWAGVHNVLVNLREPLTFANDLAQGKECAAGASLRRFMVNSTLGVGGLFDVARAYGVEAHDNDIGQTLGVWGIPAGPYMVLPGIGPSDLRGTVGLAAEYFADPVDIGLVKAGASAAVWPIAGLDTIDRGLEAAPDLDKLERSSLDGYAALRSAYRQNLADSLSSDNCPNVLRTPQASAQAAW